MRGDVRRRERVGSGVVGQKRPTMHANARIVGGRGGGFGDHFEEDPVKEI